MKTTSNSALYPQIRKYIFIFLSLCLSIGQWNSIYAQNNEETFSDDLFTYQLDDNTKTAKIKTLINPQRAEYKIPAQITTNGITYKVTSFISWDISFENPFYNNKYLTSIQIPEENEFYIQYAFEGCSNLKSIVIPEKVIRYRAAFINCTGLTDVTIKSTGDVNESAFSGCTSLKTIVIPEGVQFIQSGAFDGCSSLTSVTLPNTILGIGGGEHTSTGTGMAGDIDVNGAFEGCTSLTTIKLPNKLTSIDNFVFRNSGLKEITIPNSVTEIGHYAFSKCKSLEKVFFTPSLTNIDSYAFAESGITELSLPPTVNLIGNYAFYKCNNLKEVVIPKDNKLINLNFTFMNCENLEKITIPLTGPFYNQTFNGCSSLKSIIFYKTEGESDIYLGDIFKRCTSLQSIEIPEGVTTLDCTFIECTNLTDIIIPKSLKAIPFAFRGCTGLKTFTIPDHIKDIHAAFQGCTALTEMTIPANIQTNATAFKDCINLKKITVEGNDLESRTLYGCYNLEEIHLKSTTGTNFTSDTFTGVDQSSCIVYVPKGCLSQYTNWAGFTTIIEEGTSTKCKITYDLNSLSCSPQPESIVFNQKFETTIKANKNYLLPSDITVTMNNQKLDNGNGYYYDWTSGYFSIPIVTGDIHISAFGTENIFYKITYQLQHLKAEPYKPDAIEKDERLDIILRPDNGYAIPTEIQVYMDGVRLTVDKDYSWDTNKWLLTIQNVTGDITISATGIVENDPTPDIKTFKVDQMIYEKTSQNTVTLIGPDVEDITKWNTSSYSIPANISYEGKTYQVTELGKSAFSGAEQLTSITLPEGLEKIKINAFYKCYGLTTLEIPASVTLIETDDEAPVFDKLEIKTISVKSENNIYTSQDGMLYNKQKTTLLYCPSEYETDVINLPESVTDIRARAFDWCTNITHIIFPEGMKTIGNNALNGCKSLKSITFPARIKTINRLFNDPDGVANELKEIHCLHTIPADINVDGNTFAGIDFNTCKLYVPQGTKMKYENSLYWKNFSNIIEESEDPETIPVTGITLNHANLTLQVGEVADLEATISPLNASNHSFSWDTSDPSVVAINITGIMAIAPGEANITVETMDGHFKAICKITVQGQSIEPDVEERSDSTLTISWHSISEATHYALKIFRDKAMNNLIAQYEFDTNGQLRSTMFSYQIKELMSGQTYYIETTALQKTENETIILARNTLQAETSGKPVSNTGVTLEKLSIRTLNGQVVILTSIPVNIQIYSSSGQCVFSKTISEREYISLSAGIYIIATEKGSYKIRL